MNSEKVDVAILGAGPAGLTAGYLLTRAGRRVTILEKDPVLVGGLSRTVEYKGYLFDVGGHRFFSKSKEVEDLWTELLPNDFLERPRKSRIFYRGHFFNYPLKAIPTLLKLGPIESFLCICSYLYAKAFPKKDEKSFEDWVSNRFGRRLFRIFFKSYTEKVWGFSCSDLSADWAAQRIQNLSLGGAIGRALRALLPLSSSPVVIKSLIERFRYPRKGPGMLWKATAEKVQNQGGTLTMGAEVRGVRRLSTGRGWEIEFSDAAGSRRTVEAHEVISSIPLRSLMRSLEPTPQTHGLASALSYRAFIQVVLIARERRELSDTWLYVHEPDVQVCRIQNFKAWSPELIPEPGMISLGFEYFCNEEDSFWKKSSAELSSLASLEFEKLGLGAQSDIVDSYVIRQPKAYPVYDESYRSNVAQIRNELERDYAGLHVVGRNGMHKYNNQDHAMMTAMLTVRNILSGMQAFDPWKVNEDAQYLEDSASPSEESQAIPAKA